MTFHLTKLLKQFIMFVSFLQALYSYSKAAFQVVPKISATICKLDIGSNYGKLTVSIILDTN